MPFSLADILFFFKNVFVKTLFHTVIIIIHSVLWKYKENILLNLFLNEHLWIQHSITEFEVESIEW